MTSKMSVVRCCLLSKNEEANLVNNFNTPNDIFTLLYLSHQCAWVILIAKNLHKNHKAVIFWSINSIHAYMRFLLFYPRRTLSLMLLLLESQMMIHGLRRRLRCSSSTGEKTPKSLSNNSKV